MKKCANCGSENPDDASICEACRGRSFLSSRRLDDALKRIKFAWVAGVVSSVLTLVVSLLPALGVSVLGFNLSGILLNVFGSLIAGALSFGIYRKSRICAGALLGYFLFCKIVFYLSNGFLLSGLWTGLVFLFCFIEGVRGTFEWHSLKREQDGKPQTTVATLGGQSAE